MDKKTQKKITRLNEQIVEAETLLRTALGKKVHSATEVSVPTLTTRIRTLKQELAALTK